jgi:hypothetical protein
MFSGVTRTKTTVCTKCGSTEEVVSAACVECRRAYAREYFRRNLAKNAAKGGPLIPRERRGFCLQKKKPAPYTAVVPSQRRESGRVLDPYVPVAPIAQRGDKIPAAWEPMAVKLQHPCWVEHYTRRGSLDWAMREAGL